MHGYRLDHISMRGVFAYKGSRELKRDEINIVDIVPSILDLLEMKVPSQMKGIVVWET